MIPALFIAVTLAAPDDPTLDRYVFVLRQGDQFRWYGFQIETPNGLLAKREAELLKGWKPSSDGRDSLDSLCPEGRLLRVERLPPSPHVEPLTRALFDALDFNKDGKLSHEELKSAAKVLLDKFDADGDDCLTPLEIVPDLLTAGPPSAKPPYQLSVAQPGDPLPQPTIKSLPETALKLRIDKPARTVIAQGKWHVDFAVTPLVARPETPRVLLRPARETERKRFEAVADAVATLTIRPQARGFFELLDTNGDGQLSARELRRAWESLTEDQTKDEFVTLLEPKVHAMSLTLSPGISTPPPVRLTKAPPPERGPEWFRALDRNGDGDVSRKEFIGTDAQFKSYDTDGDGMISAEEAEAGDKKLKPGVKP